MSVTFDCDYCGHAIVAGDSMVTLESRGDMEAIAQRKHGWIGHYHTFGCHDRVVEAIHMAEAVNTAISDIPVVSNQSIAARRRKHRRPQDEGER